MATTQPPSATEKASVWEDFVDIFVSPSEVFTRRMSGDFWLPLVVIWGLFVALFFATRGMMAPIFDAEYARGAARAMARDPSLTAAQMEQGRAIAEKFIMGVMIVIPPLSIGFTGLVLWLAGKIFGAVESVGGAMMVATYSFLPRLLAFVAAVVILLVLDPSKVTSAASASLSVGHLLDPDATPHTLFQFLTRVDVFFIWQVALMGIGVSVTGKIGRAQGYMAGAIVWLVGGALTAVFQR